MSGHPTDPPQLALFPAAAGGEPPPARTDASDALLELDRVTRRRAQTEFSRPLLVEAGAGTGKTTTLTARIVAWSLGPGWEQAREAEGAAVDEAAVAAAVLGGVVAITFTEAAAAEMARRAGEAFRAVAEGEAPRWLLAGALPEPEIRRRRAKALLGTLDHLVVRTIHAFCRGLLAAHPLEAGIHPELTVDADGSALEAVAREVVEGALARGYGDPGDPDLLLLARRGYGPDALVDALITLGQAALPADALDADPFAPGALGAPLAALAAALHDLHGAVSGHLDAAVKRSPLTGEALTALGASVERVPADGALPVEELVATLSGWCGNPLRRLEEWAKGKLNVNEANAAGPQAGAIAASAASVLPLLHFWTTVDIELFQAARRALGPLHAELRRELVTRGIATFDDLLTGARGLLAGDPQVARRVRGRIRQLLVDEFQDTDAVQCDIVGALALSGAAEERPGLFVVGDPKQSIYGWRSADLRAYDAFRARLEAMGGEVLPLLENFRSVPAILDEVAAVMTPVMVPEPGWQPAFAPLVACERLAGEAGFRAGGRGPVEYWVTAWAEDGGDEPGEVPWPTTTPLRIEADAMARDVARLHHDEGVPWREMALLLRGVGDLDEYLEAFRRRGVPFAVTGDRQYFRRREVIDAAALVRAIIDPGDQLALLTVLRAPFVGVPDAALLPLWRRNFPRSLTDLAAPEPSALAAIRRTLTEAAAEVRALEGAIPELAALRGWEQVLAETVACLAELRLAFVTAPADRFLDRLRELIPLEATAAARYLGRYRLANLNRFFRRLGIALEESEGDIEAILRALRRGVAQAEDEEEGRPPAEDDALQVMTIHRAKGLDFGHVYLGQLHKLPPPDRVPGVMIGRGSGARAGQFELRLFGQASPGFGLYQAERKRVEARERVRLLYVAMTRAKHRLVLAGSWHKVEPTADVDSAKSALALLAHRFSSLEDPAELARTAKATGGRVERQGSHWYFPGLDDQPPPELGGFPSGAIARPPGDLEPPPDRREEAALRAARPLGEAVSAEAHRLLDESSRPAGGAPRTGESASSRAVGLAMGTVVHRVLEELDLTTERPLDAGRERLDGLLEELGLEEESHRRARAGALDLLDRFERGELLDRLRGLEILARELPLLAPPSDSDHGALCFRTGSIDLLARDRRTGELVVVDYKTDGTAEDELPARAEAYGPQLLAYCQAVAASFPGTPVRAELWFLAHGRVVVPRGDESSPRRHPT